MVYIWPVVSQRFCVLQTAVELLADCIPHDLYQFLIICLSSLIIVSLISFVYICLRSVQFLFIHITGFVHVPILVILLGIFCLPWLQFNHRDRVKSCTVYCIASILVLFVCFCSLSWLQKNQMAHWGVLWLIFFSFNAFVIFGI